MNNYFCSLGTPPTNINNTPNKNTIVQRLPIQLKVSSSVILPSSVKKPINKSNEQVDTNVIPTLKILSDKFFIIVCFVCMTNIQQNNLYLPTIHKYFFKSGGHP